MPLGVTQRYYCRNNGANCPHSTTRQYTRLEFERYRGLCRGSGDDGCGAQLQAGQPLDRRSWLAAAGAAVLLLAGGGGWFAKQQLFPAPLEHIMFAATQSRSSEGATQLTLEVRRNADLDRRASVEYASADGTARAGEDYEPAQGLLTFEPGEARKSVLMTILPDPSLRKPERHFSVALTNVSGAPRHLVVIEPPKRDLAQDAVIDQSVRNASKVAMDLAALVVKQRVALDLLEANRRNEQAFRLYKQAVQDVQGDLSRAREHYAQLFRSLQTMQPAQVLQTMNVVAAEHQQRGFKQQGDATALMRRQFETFLSHKSLDLDRWADELSSVVPRPPRPGGQRVPST